MRSIVSETMLMLLLVGMLTLASNIQPVRTSPTMIVVPDDYLTIQEAINNANDGDTIYVKAGTYHAHVIVNRTLTLIGQDEESTVISGDGVGNVMTIVSDGVTMMGFTITNSGMTWPDSGIMLWNVKDCNISRNRLTYNNVGIYLDHSSNNTISGNNVMSNSYFSIYLDHSSNNTISRNNVTNNWEGMWLWESSGNTVSGNNIVANGEVGIMMLYSSNNLLRNNAMSDNAYNFGFSADSLLQYTNDVDPSNTVNGKPIYYWVNQSDKQVPLDAGYVMVVNSKNITVRDLTLTNNGEGVLLAYTTDSIIQNVTTTNNMDGIMLYQQCQRNKVIGNIVSGNANSGIKLYYDSNYNLIYHNTIAFNHYQAYLYMVSFNEWDNDYGLEGNYWGLEGTYWDNGMEGNAWFNPPDENKDKIGDKPYVIDEDNIDRYPLIYPYEFYESGYKPKPDLNKDGTVNIIDVAIVARAFGCKPGDSKWNPLADLDIDGVINIIDIAMVAKQYGKTV